MLDGTNASRYAIYYSPAADHRLTRIAARWLGRDAFTGGVVPRDNVSEAVCDAFLVEPRQYGFHATLKAPFRLADGFSVGDLEQALGEFAAVSAPCPLGRLTPDLLGGFFALRAARPDTAVSDFAAQIVETFDRFRAPLNQAGMGRRLTGSLDDTEIANLTRWGNPYVFERFRFHMTLTGPVPPETRPLIRHRIEETFQPLLDEDYALDAVTLFVQESRDADFVVRSRFPLAGVDQKFGGMK